MSFIKVFLQKVHRNNNNKRKGWVKREEIRRSMRASARHFCLFGSRVCPFDFISSPPKLRLISQVAFRIHSASFTLLTSIKIDCCLPALGIIIAPNWEVGHLFFASARLFHLLPHLFNCCAATGNSHLFWYPQEAASSFSCNFCIFVATSIYAFIATSPDVTDLLSWHGAYGAIIVRNGYDA